MSAPLNVLLLGGTAEASALARALAKEERISLTVSLAGLTRKPPDLPGRLRTGGFGGAERLADWLRQQEIGALVDATHPFAATMPGNARAAASRAGVPHSRLLRPPWPVEPGWTPVPDLTAALKALPPGARAFCTTGSVRTGPLAIRPDCRLFLRAIEPPGPLPPHVTLILARPPHALADERRCMESHRISHLITRNSGGGARARLDAARTLSVPVLMIERPPAPGGATVQTVDQAVAWVMRQVAS